MEEGIINIKGEVLCSLFIFDRPLCPHSVFIIGWWCSNYIPEDIGILDYVP